MNLSSPMILNVDVTTNAAGIVQSIMPQPDPTKGRVYVLICVENPDANARFIADTAKGVKNAAQTFNAQALATASDALRYAQMSDTAKAQFLTSAQAAMDTALQDQSA